VVRTYVRVPTFNYCLTEYQIAKPWLVLSREQRTVDLEHVGDFQDWARETWPAPRYAAELAPGQTERLMSP
jgi:hypothetical protein